MIDYRKLGNRIREKRLILKLTQEDIANYADIANNTVSNIETGKTKVSLPTLVEIANCLQTSIDYLLFDSLDYVEHVSITSLDNIIQKCSSDQKRIIVETVEALYKTLNNE